jgi:2,4-dienoyl-CoA reductase-like NADH-dependent reductase (Old Yellow Enzyme family)
LKAAFAGSYIANENFTQATAGQVLAAGEADAVAFGVPFLANPDLPERFRQNARSMNRIHPPFTRQDPKAIPIIRLSIKLLSTVTVNEAF